MTEKEKEVWGFDEQEHRGERLREHSNHDLFKNMSYHQIINYKKKLMEGGEVPRYVEFAGLDGNPSDKAPSEGQSETQLKARRDLEDLVENVVDQIHKEEERSMVKIQKLKEIEGNSFMPDLPFQQQRIDDMILKEERDLNQKISGLMNTYDRVVSGIGVL